MGVGKPSSRYNMKSGYIKDMILACRPWTDWCLKFFLYKTFKSDVDMFNINYFAAHNQRYDNFPLSVYTNTDNVIKDFGKYSVLEN